MIPNVLFLILGFCCFTTDALDCFQCGTEENLPTCNIPNEERSSPESCGVVGEFCVFVHGVKDNANVVLRYCSPSEITECSDIQGEFTQIDSCEDVLSCNTDGCNNQTLITSGDRLTCYQCGVEDFSSCNANGIGDLTATECSSAYDEYCVVVKATKDEDGGSTNIVQRYCSHTEVTDCTSVSNSTSNCQAYSCKQDECNGSVLFAMSYATLLIAVSTSLGIQWKMI